MLFLYTNRDLQHNQIQELVPEHFKGLKNVNEMYVLMYVYIRI